MSSNPQKSDTLHQNGNDDCRVPKDRREENKPLRTLLRNAGQLKEHFAAGMFDEMIDICELVRRKFYSNMYDWTIDLFDDMRKSHDADMVIDENCLSEIEQIIGSLRTRLYRELDSTIAVLDGHYVACFIRGLNLSIDEARQRCQTPNAIPKPGTERTDTTPL